MKMVYVDKEGVGHLSRSDKLKTVGAVFLAAAALFGLSRIDTEEAKKYDTKTEAALQRVIQPRMTRAARKIIALAQRYPYKSYTSVKENVIETTISDSGIDPLTDSEYFVDLEVATRRVGNGRKPKPVAVTAISVSSSSTFPGSRTEGSESNITLYAPGGANTLVGLRDSHTEGWLAQEAGSIDLEGSYPPYYINSSKRSAFNPSDPVTTAKKIAKDLPLQLKTAQLDLESQRWSPGR